MLQLIRFEAKNLCQHQHIDMPLSPGLTGILGLNGKGKSNTMRGVHYLFAGDDLKKGGTRQNLLRWGSEKGYVEGTFSDGRHHFKVNRKLHTGSHTLTSTLYGELTTKESVNACLSKLAGVDVKLLGQICFARQGELARLLTGDHGDRTVVIQRLFRLDDPERCRGYLLNAMAELPAPACLSKHIEQAALRLTESQQQLDACMRELTALQPTRDKLAALKPTLEASARAPVRETLDIEYAALVAAHSALDARLTGIQVELEAAGASDKAPEGPTEADRTMRQAHVRLGAVDADLARLRTDMARCEAAMPQPPTAVAPDTALMADIADAISALKLKIKRMTIGTCPTCDTSLPLAPLEERNAAKAALADLETNLRTLQRQQAAYSSETAAWQADKAAWAEKLAGIGMRIGDLETERRGLEWSAGFDVAAYASKEALVVRHQAAQTRISALRAGEGLCRSELAVSQHRLDGMQAALAAAIPRADHDSAIDIIRQADLAVEDVRSLSGRIDIQKATLALLQEQHDGMVRRQAEGEGARRKRAVMTEARDILHPDMLPRLTLAGNLDEINARMAENLRKFGADYQVRLATTLDFACDLPGKADADAAELSGGQAVVAGIAFRLALLDVLSGGCAFMVLDEPTAFLDDPNRRSLMALLPGIAASLRTMGMTIAVPTHDPALAAVCDTKITL